MIGRTGVLVRPRWLLAVVLRVVVLLFQAVVFLGSKLCGEVLLIGIPRFVIRLARRRTPALLLLEVEFRWGC